MTKTVKAICVLIGALCVLNSIMPQINKASRVSAEDREIKAVWAATVFSLDYPGSAGEDSARLRADADRILEETRALGYNTLFFQVRPSADAFYKSEVFPWSAYLTGEQGKAPADGFDPLEYLVSKAHGMGIEVHAWINPYRVTASEKDNDLQSQSSIAVKYPELVVKHSDGKLYLNPGEPQSNRLIADGAAELVKNYSVDGIHLDDYFYPGSDFPDAETFTKYGGAFGNIEDWRRDNITNLIREIRTAVKGVRESTVFSVSPCGIWANKASNPEGSDTSGRQAYYDYYADTRLWAKENLVDWLVPQVYWNIGYGIADFEKIVKWWDAQLDGTKTKLVIGQAAYRAADETDPTSAWYGQNGMDELKRQAALMKTCRNVGGYAHYRLGSITKNGVLTEFIKNLNKHSSSAFIDTMDYPWAADAIENLYSKQIVNGMGDGSFGCARNVSRADFTLMLTRMLGKQAEFTENFADVGTDKYYYKEIGIAKALGYTNGRDGKIFDPESNITREDMATLAYRVLLKEGKISPAETSELSAKFSDAYAISDYAKEAIAAMTAKAYLGGYENGEFRPKGLATRAETAVFLNRLLTSQQ